MDIAHWAAAVSGCLLRPNKSLKAASLDSPNRRMLRIVCAACVCPLAQR